LYNSAVMDIDVEVMTEPWYAICHDGNFSYYRHGITQQLSKSGLLLHSEINGFQVLVK